MHKIVCIVGPTASGKTKLGIELCKKLSGEVVSADSMQIYKDMNIGTAKPDEEEKQGIPHHLMDFLNPECEYSVADFVSDANKIIEDITKRGKLPIITGGTGLYINSLVKKATGMALRHYLIHVRVRVAKNLLCSTKMDMRAIAKRCGFNTATYFNKVFKQETGMTPGEYRKTHLLL